MVEYPVPKAPGVMREVTNPAGGDRPHRRAPGRDNSPSKESESQRSSPSTLLCPSPDPAAPQELRGVRDSELAAGRREEAPELLPALSSGESGHPGGVWWPLAPVGCFRVQEGLAVSQATRDRAFLAAPWCWCSFSPGRISLESGSSPADSPPPQEPRAARGWFGGFCVDLGAVPESGQHQAR